MSENNAWKIEDLGGGAYLFRWFKDFYLSLFLITSEGVVAVDPIDCQAARGYRKAIISITDALIRAIIYSHDHCDHIVRAVELSESAEVFAHEHAKACIEQRKDTDVRVPQSLIRNNEVLRFGKHKIETHFF